VHEEKRCHQIIPDRITSKIYKIKVIPPEFSAEPLKCIPGMKTGFNHAAVSADNTHLVFTQQFSGFAGIGKIAELKEGNPGRRPNAYIAQHLPLLCREQESASGKIGFQAVYFAPPFPASMGSDDLFDKGMCRLRQKNFLF